MNLAIIPARSGSTRLKNKNIHPLCGKPLIRWVAEAAVESKFTMVIVSTDSDEIYKSVADLGVQRHFRGKDLADSKTPVIETIKQINEDLRPTTITYLLPTCPFILPEDIQKGFALLKDYDSVVSMVKMDMIQLACKIVDGRVVPVYDNLKHGMTNSLYAEKHFKPSGGFYMGYGSKLKECGNFFSGRVGSVIMPSNRYVDINTIEDIKYAETIYNNMRLS